MQKRSAWKRIIRKVLLLNCLSFVFVRACWNIGGTTSVELRENHSTQDARQENNQMTYLIAGNLAQPEAAFEFMESEFGKNYTYVNFQVYGWDAELAATQIADDIKAHDYQARIFTISLGDHVARYLEADEEISGQIEVYTINPCSDRSVLQAPFDTILRFCTPLAEVLCYWSGWISVLPVIPCKGGNYSLMLLVDQYYGIYYDSPPLGTNRTYGVICSTRDEFLQNAEIEKIFPDAEIVEIDTIHGDTINESDKYFDAISSLIQD